MQTFNWIQADNEYVADTVYGKAVIVEHAPQNTRYSIIGAKPEFFAHFESPNGIIQSGYTFSDFEDAEHWCSAQIMADDQSGKGHSTERLLETLALCAQVLPPDSPPTYLQRLKYIEAIIRGEFDRSIYRRIPAYPPPTLESLPWNQNENLYTLETPYGRASIAERRSPTTQYTFAATNHYKPQIQHPNWARLAGHEVITFEDAELWIIERLNELDHPHGGQPDLGNLIYTLHICANSLPPAADRIHIARLEWIEETIFGFLD